MHRIETVCGPRNISIFSPLRRSICIETGILRSAAKDFICSGVKSLQKDHFARWKLSSKHSVSIEWNQEWRENDWNGELLLQALLTLLAIAKELKPQRPARNPPNVERKKVLKREKHWIRRSCLWTKYSEENEMLISSKQRWYKQQIYYHVSIKRLQISKRKFYWLSLHFKRVQRAAIAAVGHDF